MKHPTNQVFLARSLGSSLLIGALAAHATAGWKRYDLPDRIVPGTDTDGTAWCSVTPAPETIRNEASGYGGTFTEYTVSCSGNAERRAEWKYTGDTENPAGWASVEAHAEVDGEFYVSSTPASLAHDTVVEVRCSLLPNGRVRAEITDSRMFPDASGSVSGTAYVVGTGGQLSTTIQLAGIPQKYFYAQVEENGGGDRCIDQFTIRWHTEGDAFLWVDDGILFSGQANYTMHGDSQTSIVLGVCPNCTGGSKQ